MKSAGAAGVATIAGCSSITGSGSGGGDQLVMAAGPETSANYAMFQSLAGLISQSDTDFSLEVLPSETMATNIAKLANNEVDIALVQNTGAQRLREGEGAYSELDVSLEMIAQTATTDWFLISNDSGIQTVHDIGPDTNLMPGSSAGSNTQMIKSALRLEDIEFTERNVSYGSIGTALSEDRIDVGVAANNNAYSNPVSPGWVTQVAGSTDAHVLEMSESHQEMITEQPGMRSVSFNPVNPDSWTSVPDPIRSFTTVTYIVGKSDVPSEKVRSLLGIMYDNLDTLGEYHSLLDYYNNESHWTQFPFDGYEFHSEAESFYKDNDLWNASTTTNE